MIHTNNYDKKPTVKLIKSGSEKLLSTIYKQVFRGHPWHEDLICKNTLLDEDHPLKCDMQYTQTSCEYFDNTLEGDIINDCRGGFEQRHEKGNNHGIYLLNGSIENCVGCGDKLELIDFYPNKVDHTLLIKNAIAKEGFVGYMILHGEDVLGFSWGHAFAKERSQSVNFPEIRSLLNEKGINPDKAFYASEIGIHPKMQGQGLGSIISSLRIRNASQIGYEYLLTRTINPQVHKIFGHLFGGKNGEHLFDDPERGSNWFKWDMKDLNREYIDRKAEKVDEVNN